MTEKPSVYVFGGPNGAGKSTLATTIMPRFLHVKNFVNADTIARGLSAFAPETVSIEAGRLMLKRLDELAESKSTFAFESTLSSRTVAPYLKRLKTVGYEVQIFYVWVASAEISISRIAGRVLEGGHHVPDDDVRRRYQRSISNMLELYLPLADYAEIYHNRRVDGFIKVAEKKEGELTVWEPNTWKSITAPTKNA